MTPENAAKGQLGEPLAGPSLGANTPNQAANSAPERTKRCTKCGTVKPIGEFHAHNGIKDGHRPDCKACVLMRCRKYATSPEGQKVRKERYTNNKAAGLCTSHGGRPVLPGRTQCDICALAMYKDSAKRRQLTWSLSDAQALYLLHQPCAYCNVAESGGIDRRKNEYGYTVSNSLPCCSQCNYGKRDMSAKQFIEGCHHVSKHCIDRETFMARNAELQKQLKEFEQWQSESTSAESAE